MRTLLILLVVVAAWSTPAPAQTCLTVEARDKVRGLMLDGLDAALKDQTARLFDNRLKDREPSPDRIVRGMRNAIGAYARSRAQVEAWAPLLCAPTPRPRP